MDSHDFDALFATVDFSKGNSGSLAHRAIQVTAAKYSPQFPGWEMYRRLVRGDDLLDRAIKAYFIGGARRLARARTRTGREYIGASTRDNGWLRQAALDAMDYVIFGRYARGLQDRAEQFGIAHKTYQKIRDPLALGVRFGLDGWISELHGHMASVTDEMRLGIFGRV
jgi:hypothetical protein